MATMILWQVPAQAVKAEPPAGNSGKKVVKLKRVWQISGDGTSYTGSGLDRDDADGDGDATIAEALAMQNLLDTLERDNHITRTLTAEQNQWVPQDWVLKEFHTTEVGEQPPGPIVISKVVHVVHDPVDPDPYGAIEVQVDGSVSTTNANLTMRWVWGAP